MSQSASPPDRGETENLGEKMKAWVDLIFVKQPDPNARPSAGQYGRRVNGSSAREGQHETTPPAAGPEGGGGPVPGRYRDMTGAYTSAPKIGSSIDVGLGKFHLL